MIFAESYLKLGFDGEILTAGRMVDKAIVENYEPDARIKSFSSFITTFIEVSVVYLCILVRLQV